MKECHDKILTTYLWRTHTNDSLIAKYCGSINDSSITPHTALTLKHALTQTSELLAQNENNQKTLHLLELEFTKIQSEYEVLNLWCALLTIVFLIFSFFSIFKTNEMSRQGEEALTRLGQISSEAQRKSASIDSQVAAAERRVNEHTNRLSNDASRSFADLSTNINDQVNTIQSLKADISAIQTDLRNFPEKISESETRLQTIIDDKEHTINQYIETHFEAEKRAFILEMRQQIDRNSEFIKDILVRIERIPTSDTVSKDTSIDESDEEDDEIDQNYFNEDNK